MKATKATVKATTQRGDGLINITVKASIDDVMENAAATSGDDRDHLVMMLCKELRDCEVTLTLRLPSGDPKSIAKGQIRDIVKSHGLTMTMLTEDEFLREITA